MERISKEFIGRTVRAVLFIGLTILICTMVSSAGILLASRFGLTTSREQVPLTYLSIGGEEAVLPDRGKITKGDGWTIRNTRGRYILTLSDLFLEGEGIVIEGDLDLELRQNSENYIMTQGPGIKKGAGTLNIKGEGSLEIISGEKGIQGAEEDGADIRIQEGTDIRIQEETDTRPAEKEELR